MSRWIDEDYLIAYLKHMNRVQERDEKRFSVNDVIGMLEELPSIDIRPALDVMKNLESLGGTNDRT